MKKLASLRSVSARVSASPLYPVKSGGTAGGYSAAEAQRLSDTRRQAAAKRFISPDTVFYLETGLTRNWSPRPQQISEVGKRIGVPVSHEWIYRHVQVDKVVVGGLYKHLRQNRRRYRKGYGQKRGRIPDAVSTEQRPAVVDERSRLGDWEADFVPGKQGTGAVVMLAERRNRIYLTKKGLSKDAGEVSSAIISRLSGYKDVCHTITFDNGGEFSGQQSTAKAQEADMYFAHPYSPTLTPRMSGD